MVSSQNAPPCPNASRKYGSGNLKLPTVCLPTTFHPFITARIVRVDTIPIRLLCMYMKFSMQYSGSREKKQLKFAFSEGPFDSQQWRRRFLTEHPRNNARRTSDKLTNATVDRNSSGRDFTRYCLDGRETMCHFRRPYMATPTSGFDLERGSSY